jgi:hypothetical protein
LRQRIRVFFSKTGDLRFLSSLDLARTLERALRRSGLPIAFTEGFNPRVRLSFPTAWPTGLEVERASFDFFLESSVSLMPLDEVSRRLREALPPGLEWIGAVPAPPQRGGDEALPVIVELRRTDGEPLVLAAASAASPLPEGVRSVEAEGGRVRLVFDPGNGGARIRAAVARLGLEGPGAPAVVARLRTPPGEPPLG